MKVVLTGSSGFLGQYTYKELLKYDHDIISIDNRPTGSRQVIINDIAAASSQELLRICKDANTIIHMASVVDFSESLNKRMFEVNTLASIRLAKVAKELKAHFIFISGTFIHGKEETYISDKSEDNPDLPYSLSKWLPEKIINELYEKVSILRICGIFGLNGPQHLGVNRAISGALNENKPPEIYGDGLGKRNYIFVKDAAKIICFIAKEMKVGKMYLAGKECLSIKEMAQQICEVFTPGSPPLFLQGKNTHDQIVESSKGLPETLTFIEALREIRDSNG